MPRFSRNKTATILCVLLSAIGFAAWRLHEVSYQMYLSNSLSIACRKIRSYEAEHQMMPPPENWKLFVQDCEPADFIDLTLPMFAAVQSDGTWLCKSPMAAEFSPMIVVLKDIPSGAAQPSHVQITAAGDGLLDMGDGVQRTIDLSGAWYIDGICFKGELPDDAELRARIFWK